MLAFYLFSKGIDSRRPGMLSVHLDWERLVDRVSESLPDSAKSFWREDIYLSSFSSLQGDLEVDVVIVGGGITGITAAYLLTKEGVKVALLEASRLLNGTTGHTTAKVTAQHGLIYDEYLGHFGQTKARLYYEAVMEAGHFIKETIDSLGIACDYQVEDAYLYATTDEYARKLQKEYEAYQLLNIPGELVDDIPIPIPISKALVMRQGAQFHPLKYLQVLVEETKKNGGMIFEETVAVNIKKENRAIVYTRDGYRVKGKYVLICSHFPFYEGMGLYSARMYADRSYALVAETKEQYPGGMYLSADQPNRSFRSIIVNGKEMVLIGGESHKTGQGTDTMNHYRAIEKFAHELFTVENIPYRWSAQDLTTIDKLPYIGPLTENNPNIFVATGYRKWGMTNGTAAAQLLSRLILGGTSPYESLYHPSRFYADPSLKHFLRENMDFMKHFVKGKLHFPKTKVEDIQPGEGAIITVDGERKGAYRNEAGELFVVDTTCTHVGCEVEWNSGDRTWDCPCHGSRFTYRGEVIEGPAEKPLKPHHFTLVDNFTSPEESGY